MKTSYVYPPSGAEYDVVRKSWGYYATPSLNGRLRNHGFRAVLVRNTRGKIYLLLVEEGCEEDFHAYLNTERQEILCWLDNDETVGKVADVLMNHA